MNNQDRDEAIGRLLTSMQGPAHRGPKGAGECLDAEILAAWVENHLTPAQRTAAESHVASCVSCQSMLAAMARTSVAGDAPGEQRSRSWVFRFAPWMAALGGAAAVALLVVATQPRTHEESSASAVAMSEALPAREEAAKEPPAEQREMPRAPAAPAAAPSQPRSRADAREAPTALSKDAEARQKAAANTLAKKEKVADRPRDERDLRGATMADAAAPKPAAPVPPAAQGQAAGAAPLVVAGERAQESQRFGAARQAAALDALAAPVFIQSPDANSRWRLMGGTVVQHSADGGATWTTQEITVEAPLVAGSAPRPDVCWLAGRQGSVYVTTDGRTWQRVTPPTAIDLIGIVATSADAATVAAADGRSFTTADRGRTWR